MRKRNIKLAENPLTETNVLMSSTTLLKNLVSRNPRDKNRRVLACGDPSTSGRNAETAGPRRVHGERLRSQLLIP